MCMRKLFLGIILCLLAGSTSFGQSSYDQMVRRFDYDSKGSLDLKETGVESRDGVKIHDISYASPMGGRVPAFFGRAAGQRTICRNNFCPWRAQMWSHC